MPDFIQNLEAVDKRIKRGAAAMSAELRPRILRAWKVLQGSVTQAELERLVEGGRFLNAFGILQQMEKDPVFKAFLDPVRSQIDSGAIAASRTWTLDVPGDGVNSRTFNVLNPKIVEGIRGLSTRVIDGLKGDAAKVVKEVVEQGIRDGVHPRATARKLRKYLPLAPNQVRAIDNFERMLKDGDLEAMSRKLRDRRFDRTLRKSLGRGGTGLNASQVERMTEAYRKRMVAFNANVQARTAALDAHRLGQHLAWEDAFEKGTADREHTFKTWSNSGDSRVREEHVLVNGETVKFDEAFSTGEMVPGDATYNCRCLAIYHYRPNVKGGDPPKPSPKRKTPPPPNPKPTPPPQADKFTPASTLDEAVEFAKRYSEEVDFSGGSLAMANEVNEALFDIVGGYGAQPLRSVTFKRLGGANADYLAGRVRVNIVDTEALARRKTLANERGVERGFGPWSISRNLKETMVHELGHLAHDRMPDGYLHGYNRLGGTSKAFRPMMEGRIGKRNLVDAGRVSQYAATNTMEHFAESWTAYHTGQKERLTEDLIDLIEEVIENFKAGGAERSRSRIVGGG